jgi:catechol 2,3-dioxygenase-like lactoylglutathione lyase family enzyme
MHESSQTGLLARPVHHIGFNVPDLRAAIDNWVTVYGAGPFYVNEHVAYDESTSGGMPVAWDHSAGFGQWGALPVELQQTHDLRPPELIGPFTAAGRSAVNHVGVTVEDPAAESARLESLGFRLCMHARLGDVEFFWHDATEAFGYCIEIITAGPGLDAFFDTVAGDARVWDGRDPIRRLG